MYVAPLQLEGNVLFPDKVPARAGTSPVPRNGRHLEIVLELVYTVIMLRWRVHIKTTNCSRCVSAYVVMPFQQFY